MYINLYIYILYMLLYMFEKVINISSKTFFVPRNSIHTSYAGASWVGKTSQIDVGSMGHVVP